jgi:hypothetical protein
MLPGDQWPRLEQELGDQADLGAGLPGKPMIRMPQRSNRPVSSSAMVPENAPRGRSIPPPIAKTSSTPASVVTRRR